MATTWGGASILCLLWSHTRMKCQRKHLENLLLLSHCPTPASGSLPLDMGRACVQAYLDLVAQMTTQIHKAGCPEAENQGSEVRRFGSEPCPIPTVPWLHNPGKVTQLRVKLCMIHQRDDKETMWPGGSDGIRGVAWLWLLCSGGHLVSAW